MARNQLTAALCAAMLLAAPVGLLGADREHQQIMGEIRMLQEQSARLQLAMASFEDALRQISAKIDAQTDIARRAFADQQLSIGAVADGMRILRERFDDTNVRISSLSQEIEALRIAIPPLSPALTQLGTESATGLPLDVPAAAAAAAPAVAPGMSPQRMFDTAWADYTNGQWMLSIQGFEAYIRTYPRSELADNAQFYIGQSYYADGAFQDAVEAFDEVLRNYPDGDAVPETSYKLGLALDRLGYGDRARQAFELVVTNYPDNTMATLAQQALDRLNQQ